MASDSVYWARDMAKFYTYKKHPVHRNSSAMVINMDFIVTDIKQTCLGQGLRVTILPRENAHLSLCSPRTHEGLRSYR